MRNFMRFLRIGLPYNSPLRVTVSNSAFTHVHQAIIHIAALEPLASSYNRHGDCLKERFARVFFAGVREIVKTPRIQAEQCSYSPPLFYFWWRRPTRLFHLSAQSAFSAKQ
jgi:hypothetical protein